MATLLRLNSVGYSAERHLMHECPRSYFLDYVLPSRSPFLDPLNKMLSQLQAAGILEYLKAASYHHLQQPHQRHHAQQRHYKKVTTSYTSGHQTSSQL